jgi:flagellar biosynthesis protein FlhF
MKTKRIAAPTMNEALKKVKKELGPDAVILYTKKVTRSKWLPPFRKEFVEVVAALDEVNKLNESFYEEKAAHEHPGESPRPVSVRYSEQVSRKVPPEPSLPLQKERGKGSELSENEALIPEPIREIYSKFVEEDLNPKILDQLVQSLLKEWYINDMSLTNQQVNRIVSDFFEKQFQSVNFSGKHPKTKLITLVGPTGVGKTTTAAKIASKVVLEEEKTVAFITTDTYRMAAVDQLKTYAKILNVPISVVYTKEDFQEALDTLKDYDLIIVDSAGRNYQQKKYVNELLQLIPFKEEMETYLVLSATSKLNDLKQITSQFSTLPISSYLFTKLDETLSIGNVGQLLLEYPHGVAYFTNGQDVPDDIMMADRTAFIEQMVKRATL